MNLSIFYAVILALMMVSCHQKKVTSNLDVLNTGPEQCSDKSTNFLDLPVNCQVKIISLLEPRELVRFTKALSKQTKKSGFEALLNQARLRVPEQVQHKIESYTSRFLDCMGGKEPNMRKSLLFIEKLLAHYFFYIKLMHKPNEFKFTNVLVKSDVAPISLGDTQVAYMSSRNDKLFLEIRDVITSEILASQEVASDAGIQRLRPMGSHSFVSVDQNEGATVWTFDGKVIKNQGISFPVKNIVNIGQIDGFFVRNNGKLLRYLFIGSSFEKVEFGEVPAAISSADKPEFKIFPTKPDQIITFTAINGQTQLQSWKLSSKSIYLKRQEQFLGTFETAKALKNDLISFVTSGDNQHSVVIYDAQRDQEVLRISHPSRFIKRDYNIDYLDDFTLSISRPNPPPVSHLNELRLYRGTSWKDMVLVKVIDDAYFSLPFDEYIVTKPWQMTSLKNPDNDFSLNFTDRSIVGVLKVPLKDALLMNLSRLMQENDFSIVSIWKTVTDVMPMLNESLF